MMDIRDWLTQIGLERYTNNFTDNDIDWSLLEQLDHAVLKDIGVNSAGHRLRLLSAAKAATTSAIATRSTSTNAVETSTGNLQNNRLASNDSAERRQLTVMFCDLVGSTTLSGTLDPEVLRNIIRDYQITTETVVRRYDGHIAQYLGDGLMVYFGFPLAHEDDVQRAVYAGIAIPTAIERLNVRLKTDYGIELAVRIGVHTGPVVVGTVGGNDSRENLAMGETPNIAARLQSMAQPGQLIISDQTRQFLGQRFALQSVGEQRLKGVSLPLRPYLVTGEQTTETRFDADQASDPGPIVGRELQLDSLLRRWQQAEAGHGQVVLVTGEAGIGKSRIINALSRAVLSSEHRRLTFQCSPFHSATALHPVSRQIAYEAEFESNDTEASMLQKLQNTTIAQQQALSQTMPILGSLLNLSDAVHKRYGTPKESARKLRKQTLQLLATRFTKLSNERPLLIVIEDAHWIDPTTLELVELVMKTIAKQRLLLLITTRAPFDLADTFRQNSACTTMSVERLTRQQTMQIVQHVTDGKPVPQEVFEEIVSKTDGVPLFVEELTKTLLESGQLQDTGADYQLTGELGTLSVPSSLHDSLMARLDRIVGTKAVAQTAACIGREFNRSLLAEVIPLSDRELDDALNQLILLELVVKQAPPADYQYLFTHALVRDAAYESLLHERRLEIHSTLLQHLRQSDANPPQILAHHAAKAGMQSEAAAYSEQAGEQARTRFAFGEAIRHFESARRRLKDIDCSSTDDASVTAARERQLQVEIKLAQSSVSGRGHGSSLTAQSYERATQLADTLPDSPMWFPAYYGRNVALMVRSELEPAATMAYKMLQHALREGNDIHRLMATCSTATIATFQGNFHSAAEQFEDAQGLCESTPAATFIKRFGHEPRGVAFCHYALALWSLGKETAAVAAHQQGMQLAQESDHVPSQAQPIVFGAILATLRHDTVARDVQIQNAINFSKQHNMQQWYGVSLCLLSQTHLDDGEYKKARETLDNGRALLSAAGTKYLSPLLLQIDSNICLAEGKVEDAFNALFKAKRHEEVSGEMWLAAQGMLNTGKLFGQHGDKSAAKAAFQGALVIAREQKCSSMEEQATADLAHLAAAS